MCSMFLSSYRNTCESLGELKKAVETLPCCSYSTAFLILPNFHFKWGFQHTDQKSFFNFTLISELKPLLIENVGSEKLFLY